MGTLSMRLYKSDGSFVEAVNDKEFGWYFFEIMVDESNEKFDEINKETRYLSKQKKLLAQQFESIDFSPFEDIETVAVEKIIPDVKIETIFEIETYSKDEIPTTDELLSMVDINFPPKDRLANMINPCNAATRTLLSVINHSKYSNFIKDDPVEAMVKSVNMKSTNFQHLMSDRRTSLAQDMINEIVNYHATKEDNMLSLMMELVLTDVDRNIEDVVKSPEPQKEIVLPQFVFETSDLGNSLPSSSDSSKEEAHVENNYLQVSNRSHILSSIGLSEEDKSIQSFCEETFEMHQELADIRKSFQEAETKVNDLLKQACALKNDLKETLYLNDIINLLKGDIDKVKLKKLPFRIFYEAQPEANLII